MATVEAVARENGAVLAGAGADGVAVFPADEEFTGAVARSWPARAACMTFGDADAAPTSAWPGAEWQQGHWQVQRATPAGPLAFRLHIAGRHNVRNSLAAAACALAAGVPLAAIAAGLAGLRAGQGPLARAAAAAGAAAPSRWSTTPTTPTPIRCAPPSTCWPNCPARACWCWATWARSATRGRSSMPRSATTRASAASSSCSRWASSPRRGMAGRHFDDIEALNAAVLAQLPAGGQRAGQGLALHEDGAGGAGHRRAGTRATTRRESAHAA